MKGVQKLDQRSRDAAYKEIKQCHNRIVFELVNINELTKLEKKRAMESLIFSRDKRQDYQRMNLCQRQRSERTH
jgi:hypothetical protein